MRASYRFVCRIGIVVALLLSSTQGFAQIEPLEDLLGIGGLAVIQVAGVDPGLPADVSGVRPGDLIGSFNGHTLREFDNFRPFLSAMRTAAFETGAVLEVLGYDPASDSYVPRGVQLTLSTRPADSTKVYLGLSCGFAYFVTEVRSGTPAHRLGLAPGDFIEWINGQHGFDGPAAMDRAVSASASSPGREITLWVTRWRPIENGKTRGSHSRTLTGRL